MGRERLRIWLIRKAIKFVGNRSVILNASFRGDLYHTENAIIHNTFEIKTPIGFIYEKEDYLAKYGGSQGGSEEVRHEAGAEEEAGGEEQGPEDGGEGG